MITADQVIRRRQMEIFNRIQEIESELRQLDRQKKLLEDEKTSLLLEHDLWNEYEDRGSLSMTTTTTTTNIRMGSKDRLVFEDVLKKIFDNVGRPMRVTELISALESFGYQWSSYSTAHAYITKTPILEKVPQTRGIYQLRR